jgi:hypothetical protein
MTMALEGGGRSGQMRKISPPPGFDPWTAQLVASPYTDYATWPTYLWQLVLKTGILFSLKMVHLYQNMMEICFSYSYITDILHLIGDIKLSVFNNLLNQTISNIQMKTKFCTVPTVLV